MAHPTYSPSKILTHHGNAKFGCDHQGLYLSGQRPGDESSYSIASGNFNRDGDLDARVANYQSASKMWVNDGGNQQGTRGVYSTGQDIGNPTGHGIAVGDLDCESDLDAFAGSYLNSD
jgi:hypothetical protein